MYAIKIDCIVIIAIKGCHRSGNDSFFIARHKVPKKNFFKTKNKEFPLINYFWTIHVFKKIALFLL